MANQKLRECPICGHESWPIVYGMMTPDVMREFPEETVFEGCVMEIEERIEDGKYSSFVAQWSCQNPDCGQRW